MKPLDPRRHCPAKARVAQGDPLPPEDRLSVSEVVPSLDTLYRERAPRLLRYFTRRASIDEAPDLAQETFARLARVAPDVAVNRPEAYIVRIARNLLHDRAKARRRHSSDQHFSIEDVELLAPDQLRALEARDMLNRIEVAMLSLPMRVREVFLAHRLDGFSYGEIAVRTGLSVKTIEKDMSRAIAHLDRVLSRR